METKIVRIGNSQGLRIPKAVLEQAQLEPGQRVRLKVVDDTIVIAPERKARQGWKELFAKEKVEVAEDLWKDIPADP
ncbi:MAG: AbrB/MazE/SpoVT family DNA-binding domain-containing protein [Burkholderiales bacterium]